MQTKKAPSCRPLETPPIGIIKVGEKVKNCYHSLLRWLTLWLPHDVSMYEHLTESSYDGLVDEFWMAIAPYRFPDVPWNASKFFEWRRSVYRPPTPMEEKIKSHQPDFDGLPF